LEGRVRKGRRNYVPGGPVNTLSPFSGKVPDIALTGEEFRKFVTKKIRSKTKLG